MTLVEHIRRHAKAFLFAIVMLVLSGLVLLDVMPVSLFPDITFPRIVILADNGEQPAERMMIEVTRPLEETVSSVPGVQVVRSITGRGSTEISVGLEWGADVQQTLQLLQGRIANTRSQLPPSANVQAEQMMVAVFPILGYSLTSDTLSQVELRDIALYQIRPALMRVNGVARVEVTGGDTREFVVTVSPPTLAAYHLTVGNVTDAIRRTNSIVSPGLVDNNHLLYLSLVSGQFLTGAEIESCVVTVRNGIPLRVRDVGAVRPGVADKFIRTTAHGRDAVLLSIMKQPTGSTVEIGREAMAELATLNLPRGVRIENFYDQGGFIKSSIRATRDSIVVGIVLAMIVLLVFLRSWRITLVVAGVVPATIAATFVCLSAAGKTVNIMTLGGIAAAVGLIIDDSIVIIENIFAQVAQWQTRPDEDRGSLVALIGHSVQDLMPAVLGSTASTIVIHVPLAFLGGVTGAFFTSLSVTMVFAMTISFIFSITLAPLFASYVLRDRDVDHELQRAGHRGRLQRWFEGMLPLLLRRRWFALPVIALLATAIVLLYGAIGSDFMPEMDEGNFVLDYKSPPGTSLSETHRMLMGVEAILMDTPEVESYSRRTGTQLGFFLTEPNDGDFLVKLKARRDRTIFQVMDEVRSRVNASQPSLTIEFGQLMMDVIGDLTNNPSPVEIKIFGEDSNVLQETAQEVSRLIEHVPGVVDVFSGIVIAGPSLILRVDPLKAALAGLDVTQVQDQAETVIRGKAESVILRGEKLIAVRVRYPEAYRYDPDRLEQLMLTNSAGTLVPLRAIASIEKTAGQAEIHREG
jgi:multidrug efflux pump subunit AcrB